jgi:hypothetical protein
MPYSKASESDREFIIDDLDYLHTVVRQKLISDPDLARYVNELLLIPSQEQIFIYHDKDGMPKITLAQWGCSLPRSRRGFDPLGLIIEERKKTHTPVVVVVKWTDNEPVANKPFKFSYKYSVIDKPTDQDGLMRIGMLKNGAEFTIADAVDPSICSETFEVIPDKKLYTITIPYYTSVEVNVIDQLDQPVAGCDIKAQHGNDEDKEFTTNEQGVFKIEKILYDKNPLTLFLLPEGKINKGYNLARDPNKLVFRIYRTIHRDASITVINTTDNKPVANRVLKVKYNGVEKELATGSEGAVLLEGLELDTTITVTDAEDQYNYKDFTVNLDNNEFIFPVELPEILNPVIKVVNKKDNTPVGAYPLKVKTGDNEQELYSKREGIIPLNNIKAGVKIRVTDVNDPYNNAEYTIDSDNVELIFPVELPELVSPRIKVINKADDTIVEAYPLKVTIGGEEQLMHSNREGLVLLEPMKKDETISVVDGNNPYNNTEYDVDDEEEEYIFTVELPVEKMVKIKLIDLNKEVMPNHLIDIIVNGVVYKKTTDEEGRVSLPASLFTHGQKIKVEVLLTEEERRKKKKSKTNKQQ